MKEAQNGQMVPEHMLGRVNAIIARKLSELEARQAVAAKKAAKQTTATAVTDAGGAA
jgi:hypothetical protein